MTIEQLATATILSPRMIKALCRDLVSGRMRLSTLEKVAEALGSSICELIVRSSGQADEQLTERRA